MNKSCHIFFILILLALIPSQGHAIFTHRFLLVDDDPDDLYLRKLILEQAGVTNYLTAMSAREGFDLAVYEHEQGRPFEIIITDMRMPDVDGLGFLRMIREEPRLASVPFVVITDSPVDYILTSRRDEIERYKLSGLISKSTPIRERLAIYQKLIDGCEGLLLSTGF